jgi:hypothetical protein
MSEFTEAFHNVARQMHIPPGYRYPSQLIKDWSTRVARLKANGYHEDVAEYDNDLSVRGYIEEMIHRHELSGFEESKEFQKRSSKTR